MVDPGRAGQCVREVGTLEPFDANIGVPCSIGPGLGAGGQVNRHRAGGVGVAGDIDADAAVEYIGPGSADEHVGARPSGQRIDANASAETVIAVVAPQLVRSGTATQCIAPCQAMQLVVQGVAQKSVAIQRPGQVLDIGQ